MAEERLIHYSGTPLAEVYSIEQTNQGMFKPSGLWVSVEGYGSTWKDWCEAEEFRPERLIHAHEIELAPGANILRLAEEEAILAFTKQYRRPEIGQWYQDNTIDWPRVASEYQGVLIAPYAWTLRLDPRTAWYYPWDCASGCIWDAKAIATWRAKPHE
jgi:hypothetical protein